MHLRPSLGSVVLAGVGIAGLGFAWNAQVQAEYASAVRRTAVVTAVERSAPAVVNITTDGGGSRGWVSQTIRGSGSGVIVHPDGYVVTNSHVVRGAARITVELSRANGGARGKGYAARLLEDDPAHDLALLRIATEGPAPYVGLCSTCGIMIGETAIAIGNPYGLGDSVTVGIVSALDRTASISSGYTVHNLIQTDASINQGNSGGALLNLEGNLIGINCAIHPSARGIAFTVPADEVQTLLDRNLGAAARPAKPAARAPASPTSEPSLTYAPEVELLPPSPAPSTPPAPRVSAPLATVPPARALPGNRPGIGLALVPAPGAVLVATVTPGSSADIAGLVAGDLLLDVDGKAVTSPAEVAATFNSAPSGRTFFVNLRRGDRRASAILVVPFK